MNEDLQRGIIGDFLLEGRDLSLLRELAHKYGLLPQHFADSALRTAYETVLAETDKDRLLLSCELAKKLGAELVEKCIALAGVSIVDAESHIRQLANEGIRAEVREITERKLREFGGKASADFIIADIQSELSALSARCGETESKGFSLAELADPIPEEENPNALIRGGWLRKGHGAIIASVTGSGKSVISLQFAYAWAAGREIFGLSPLRPLRIGIFETEDDEEEIAWFRESMRRGYETLCGWSRDEIHAAERNIQFEPTRFKAGRDFVNLLAKVQRKEHYDLVIINPLQGVCGCNLSDNNEMRKLLTEWIDPVIKSPETACGLLIVHHTNKPTIHNGQQGFGGDQYAEYLGAGAGALSNWMRAMLAIMPVRNEEGRYHLIAAKRGGRLGWPKREDLKCTKPTRVICHSPDELKLAFWQEEVTAQPSPVRTGPDPAADAERLAADLRKLPRTLTDARNYAKELFGNSKRRSENAYDLLLKEPSAFGLIVESTGVSTQKLIGSPEGVENAFSSLREKQVQKLLSKTLKK